MDCYGEGRRNYNTPYPLNITKPGTPTSDTVGRSGSEFSRREAAAAGTLNLLDFTKHMTAAVVSGVLRMLLAAGSLDAIECGFSWKMLTLDFDSRGTA